MFLRFWIRNSSYWPHWWCIRATTEAPSPQEKSAAAGSSDVMTRLHLFINRARRQVPLRPGEVSAASALPAMTARPERTGGRLPTH